MNKEPEEEGIEMSDTPRMDLALRRAQEDCTESYLLTEGRKLERQLNAANERIKRLESVENSHAAVLNAIDNWIQQHRTKEAKL
jgi:hypothetical protein